MMSQMDPIVRPPVPVGSAANLVMAAALLRGISRKIGDTGLGSAMNQAISSVLQENGLSDPDGPEPRGPGAPVERMAMAAELLQAAAQLPAGPIQRDLLVTAKHLIFSMT
jgi:hypothetical protein